MAHKQFFVSYARADWDAVDYLTSELATDGAKLWIDQRDIRAGDEDDQTHRQSFFDPIRRVTREN